MRRPYCLFRFPQSVILSEVEGSLKRITPDDSLKKVPEMFRLVR